jgi:signal peptidase
MDGHAIVVGRLPGVPRPSTLPVLAPAERPADSAVRRLARRAGRLALNCAFVAMIASVLVMLVPALLGFQRYVILTGSMTGTYDRGSIVFDRPIPTADLKVGDPITYSPPAGFTSQTRVTHRIWWIGRGANGQRVYRTKGDANKHPDAWKFTLNQSTQNVVVFHIPDVGYVFTLLSLRDFRIALLGLPAIVIALMTLRALWIEGGMEARRQKLAELGWQTITDTGLETVLPPLDAPDTNPQPVWLDLRLTAVRAGAPLFASTNRPPSSPRATLHVGRLVYPRTMGGVDDALLKTRKNLDGLPPAPNTATIRLRVARLFPESQTPGAPALDGLTLPDELRRLLTS